MMAMKATQSEPATDPVIAKPAFDSNCIQSDVFAQFNGKAVYKDFVQSYSTVEPAIDLTASSFLAFAWQIAGTPSGTP
jgi:hypothetical protein